VVNNHVLDTSLGYFMSPLVNVLLAVVVLHERLTGAQRVAVGIAACGVLLLAWQLGAPPWVALCLALSFGLYGLVRKLVAIDPVQGLAIESGLMAVPALAYVLWCAASGQGHFLAGSHANDLLLVLGGPVTAVPLVLFAYAAQRVSMLTLGLMQYIVPTLVLLLGLWVYHEPFGGVRAIAFGCIWLALALFSGEALWRRQRAR
jgi:chloramphenicol-sensitive protein RarD